MEVLIPSPELLEGEDLPPALTVVVGLLPPDLDDRPVRAFAQCSEELVAIADHMAGLMRHIGATRWRRNAGEGGRNDSDGRSKQFFHIVPMSFPSF